MLCEAARWCGFFILLPLFSLEIPPMTRSAYPTDLTVGQWAILAPLIPPPHKNCRPREADMREVVDAILYLLRTSCAWRLLPHDLPPYRTVFYYFSKWRKCGVWKKIHDELHERLREREGREAQPSAAIIDSQSAKTGEKGGPSGATTRARRSRGASAISSSTRSA
jgi:transposase